MKGKKIANILFYSLGTTLLCYLAVVISLNFYKDSRLLGFNYDRLEENQTINPIEDEVKNLKESSQEEFETFTYEGRIIRSPKPPKVADQTNKVLEDPLYEKEKVFKAKVLLFNHSGVKALQEKVQESIENLGYDVDLVEDDKVRSTTVIVQKSENDFGLELQEFFKKGQIVKEVEDNSEYQIFFVLGEDFLP